jgi:ABC-2 type transport system permease protein
MKSLALARATLRGTTWISSDGLRELARKDRLWVLPLAGLGILVGLGVVEYMVIGVYRSLLAAGSAAGHPEMLIFYGLLGSWAFMFVTAIPLALSVLYYSKDLAMLLVLPVRPLAIVLAKLLLLYCYCLPVNLVLFVPALWLFIGATGWSLAAVASGFASLFVLPVLPLALATLLVLGLMKVVNLSRYRVALEVSGMALGIVLVIGFQVMLSRTTLATLEGGAPQALAGFPGLFDAASRVFPPAAWAARGFVAGSGPIAVLLSILVTAAALALALVLAPVNFLRDVTERRERGSARRRAGAKASELIVRASVPRSVVRRLVGREWSILSSNSTFIFEAIGELLVLPLLLAVYGLILPKQMLAQVMQFISAMPALGPALMGVLVLMTSLTTVSSTSVSREGPRMALSLSIPVPGRTQVKAKLLFHLLFFTTAYLADLAIVWVLFRFPPASLVYMVPGGVALQIVAFTLSIFFDLKKPFLNWTHPQQAMKNNINAMSGIGSSAAVVAIVTVPGVLLALKGVDAFLVGCGAAAAGIILAAILLPRVLAFADRQYGGGLELGG